MGTNHVPVWFRVAAPTAWSWVRIIATLVVSALYLTPSPRARRREAQGRGCILSDESGSRQGWRASRTGRVTLPRRRRGQR